jgi:hypothetical protein
VQVVIDCLDPARLSNFYAEALQYELQPPPGEYKSWEEALIAWGVPQEDWNSSSAIVDPEGKGPRIYFQKMDTPKLAKNRVHLDVNASGGVRVDIQERKKQIHTKSSV